MADGSTGLCKSNSISIKSEVENIEVGTGAGIGVRIRKTNWNYAKSTGVIWKNKELKGNTYQ
jgi:hypothetical protein